MFSGISGKVIKSKQFFKYSQNGNFLYEDLFQHWYKNKYLHLNIMKKAIKRKWGFKELLLEVSKV